VTDDQAPLWTDQAFLRDVQYRDDANLAARQSIYAYAEPKRDLIGEVLASLDLTGEETVVDVGCGNGRYLAGLAARGHRGPVLGVDMSPGMLAAARQTAPVALACGDAMAMPTRAAAADVSLAMHMLYHVPEPEGVIAELRRITRRDGRVIVVLNGCDHLAEVRALVNAELAAAGYPADHAVAERITLDDGEVLLGREFGSVVRHDLTGQLRIPGPEPVLEYVRSMSLLRSGPEGERLTSAIADRLEFEPEGFLRVTTHVGWLICS
jgi:SAM-dependent methyltransferase